MKPTALFTLVFVASAALVAAQEAKPKPEDTEVWKPAPHVVSAGATCGAPPSDAIVLFDGKSQDEWVSAQDHTPAKWNIVRGLFTVAKGTGNIETRRTFKNYQFHIEWRIPADITGSGQGRGNSGVFLASTGPGDAGYELQILDPWNNPTYVNGMAGSLYKQAIPLVNPGRKPGEWQTYDVVWTAPIFNDDGSLKRPPTPLSSSTASWLKTTSNSRARPSMSVSPSIRNTTARPSSSRPMATRASRSVFATSGSASSREPSGSTPIRP